MNSCHHSLDIIFVVAHWSLKFTRQILPRKIIMPSSFHFDKLLRAINYI